jgi:uncharacterized protein YpmB
MNPILKKVLIWAAVAMVILMAINSGLWKLALMKAELANRKIKAEAAQLAIEKDDLLKASEAQAIATKGKIAGIQAVADQKMAQAASIKTKSAQDVKAIRNEKITLDEKYNKLEADSLKKVEKIGFLEAANVAFGDEIAEWKILEAQRVETLAKMNSLIEDPKTGYKALLKASTETTESILKKNPSWPDMG